MIYPHSCFSETQREQVFIIGNKTANNCTKNANMGPIQLADISEIPSLNKRREKTQNNYNCNLFVYMCLKGVK